MTTPFRHSIALGYFILFALPGCGESPPQDALDFEDNEQCILMNAEPIPPHSSDPHEGVKNVYACNITEQALIDLTADPNPVTYPEGTLIIKESRREHQDFAWLLATARKINGAWQWKEYKRNFEDEKFLSILASEDVCTSCHKDARKDFIWVEYEGAFP